MLSESTSRTGGIIWCKPTGDSETTREGYLLARVYLRLEFNGPFLLVPCNRANKKVQ